MLLIVDAAERADFIIRTLRSSGVDLTDSQQCVMQKHLKKIRREDYTDSDLGVLVFFLKTNGLIGSLYKNSIEDITQAFNDRVIEIRREAVYLCETKK